MVCGAAGPDRPPQMLCAACTALVTRTVVAGVCSPCADVACLPEPSDAAIIHHIHKRLHARTAAATAPSSLAAVASAVDPFAFTFAGDALVACLLAPPSATAADDSDVADASATPSRPVKAVVEAEGDASATRKLNRRQQPSIISVVSAAYAAATARTGACDQTIVLLGVAGSGKAQLASQCLEYIGAF